MLCLWLSRLAWGSLGDLDVCVVMGEPELIMLYVSGLNPSPFPPSCPEDPLLPLDNIGSSDVRFASVMVLSDDWEDGGRGRVSGMVGDIGDVTASSSSGFAMRSPPSDWAKLRSPFILPVKRAVR